MARDLHGGKPIAGTSLSAYLKAMSSLLVFEADRRRVAIELQKGKQEEPPAELRAVDIEDYRKRAASSD